MQEANNVLALSSQLTQDALVSWSDEKRKDFVKTFDERVRVAQFILLDTAAKVVAKATDKQFISGKHTRGLEPFEHLLAPLIDGWKSTGRPSYYYGTNNCVGGRPTTELNKIAGERADLVLENLPALKDAVRIISPEISKMIEQREGLFEQGKKVMAQSEEVSGSLDMDDFPVSMTLGAFKTMVKDRENKRKKLLEKLSEIGEEGQALDRKINKFLYAGLPGLSDAVMKVVKDHIERAAAFSTMNRRVGEQVQYGDSKSALELLKGFEQDEVTVSDEIKAQFDNALKTLKLAGTTKKVKALKKGK
jgi:hypothetical protein